VSVKADARRARALERAETWTVEPLAESAPLAPESFEARLERMEELRRVGCALAGIPYPDGPTPKHVRRRWPVERIG